MYGTMTQWMEAIRPTRYAWALRKTLEPPIDRLSSVALTSAGLVIHGSASALAKTGSADFYASVQGVLVKIAASTDMPALTGCNAAAGAFNVACFYVDGSGVVKMLPGTQGATLAKVVMPVPTKNQAMVGMLIITYASAFTGGTTALDTATTVYVNSVCGFDPSALTG